MSLGSQSSPTLSIVVRAHEGASLALLDEALFSIAMSDRQLADGATLLLERVLVTQVADVDAGELYGALPSMRALLAAHAHPQDPSAKLVVLPNPDGRDLRSQALNLGLEAATGHYIAFLDYDDLIYPSAYTLLVNQLRRTGAVLAAGGAVRAQVQSRDSGLYVQRKLPWLHLGTRQSDLLQNNFLPLHSFVINRAECRLPQPWFDERLSRLEDYDFLLRLASTAPFDLSQLDRYVCEYRLVARHQQVDDGTASGFSPTNVNPLSNRDSANLAAWAQAKRHIAALKPTLAAELRAQAAHQVPWPAADQANTQGPQESVLAFVRAARIAVDQSGGFWAFLRRLIQLAQDIGIGGVARRAKQIVRRL